MSITRQHRLRLALPFDFTKSLTYRQVPANKRGAGRAPSDAYQNRSYLRTDRRVHRKTVRHSGSARAAMRLMREVLMASSKVYGPLNHAELLAIAA